MPPNNESYYIYDQNSTKNIKYGKYSSDYNGCGWIAVYNYLNYKIPASRYDEIEQRINFIIESLSNGIWFNGKFGTRISQICKYLRKTEHVDAKLTRKINLDIKRGILFYFTGSTFHYTFFHILNNGLYRFYNVNNDIQEISFENFLKLNVKLRLFLIINIL